MTKEIQHIIQENDRKMEENHEWANIPGFEGLYEASNNGLIRSFKTKMIKGLSLNNSGYFRAELYKNNERERLFVHRVVASLFVPKKSDSFDVVNHIDGNKQNNHYTNLEWTNKSGNQVHAVKMGLTKKLPLRNGTRNFQSKLTDSDVKVIRQKRDSGSKLKELALEFGVTESNISIICLKKGWKHTNENR